MTGTEGERCPKCGMSLQQLGIFSRSFPKTSPLVASIRTSAPLKPGEIARGTVKLTKADGTPVYDSELRIVHTKKIHLLVVDSSLTDYHHLHPAPTGAPGEYEFEFTPSEGGSYLSWADVLPDLSGREEYVFASMQSLHPRMRAIAREPVFTGVNGDMRFELAFDSSSVSAGTGRRCRLKVTGADGKPFTRLEPVMGAFAHLVGFNENLHSLVHLHPIGNPPATPDDRAGPELEFILYSEDAGFMKLFAQVQVNGEQRIVPFGIKIEPRTR